MRIAGERIALRDEPQESDNKDHFRWRNLEEWDYYDEPQIKQKFIDSRAQHPRQHETR